jgi:hypothetical protein
MTQNGSLSLTDYLIELSHDYDKLKAFWEKEPSTRGDDPRLTDQARDALNSNDLARIQEQVAAENQPDTPSLAPSPALVFLSPLRPINF